MGQNIKTLLPTTVAAITLCLSLTACDTTTELTSTPSEQTNSDAAPAIPAMTEDVMRKWASSCALCHVQGVGGAPRIGHHEEWLPRLAQGRRVMLKHTIEGFNNMPPLGYCMSCEESDFTSLIEFMVGTSQ